MGMRASLTYDFVSLRYIPKAELLHHMVVILLIFFEDPSYCFPFLSLIFNIPALHSRFTLNPASMKPTRTL